MQLAALIVVRLAGIWLAAVGLLMMVRPDQALHMRSGTATGRFANTAEQVPQLLAGAALMARADYSKFPPFFDVAGGAEPFFTRR